MGRIYVTDALIPTVRLLTDAYKQGLIDAGKAYNMAYGMAYHKEERETEERLSPCTPFYKEEKEKEERDAATAALRASARDNSSRPRLDDVRRYVVEIGGEASMADEFYDYYTSYGWKCKDGNAVADWQALVRVWKRRNERKSNKSTGKGQQRQQTLLAAETRLQEQAEQQTAERNERLKEQAEKAVSYQEYQRMKREGKV